MKEERAYQETFTSKYRHLAHNNWIFVDITEYALMLAWTCHFSLSSKTWRVKLPGFGEIWKELDSKSRFGHSRGRGGVKLHLGKVGGGHSRGRGRTTARIRYRDRFYFQVQTRFYHHLRKILGFTVSNNVESHRLHEIVSFYSIHRFRSCRGT